MNKGLWAIGITAAVVLPLAGCGGKTVTGSATSPSRAAPSHVATDHGKVTHPTGEVALPNESLKEIWDEIPRLCAGIDEVTQPPNANSDMSEAFDAVGKEVDWVLTAQAPDPVGDHDLDTTRLEVLYAALQQTRTRLIRYQEIISKTEDTWFAVSQHIHTELEKGQALRPPDDPSVSGMLQTSEELVRAGCEK
jgi:hypothetical protein